VTRMATCAAVLLIIAAPSAAAGPSPNDSQPPVPGYGAIADPRGASSASRPPGTPIVTLSQSSPRAGKSFPAFVLVFADPSIRSADAECRGSVGGRSLRGIVRTFASSDGGAVAVVCSYAIPQRTAGKTFIAWANTLVEHSRGVTHGDGVPHRWRITR
jgi:hypothetical protein